MKLSPMRGKAENRIERCGLACAIGADESENAPLFHTQIDAVQRHRIPEGFAQAVCFYARHVFTASFRDFDSAGFARAVSEDGRRVASVSRSSAFRPSR